MENMFDTEGITSSDRMLHTPGAFAKKHLLYVQEVGTLKSLTPHTCKRENLDSYLIFEVTRGKGTLLTEGKRYSLSKGDCIWLDCRNGFEHISSEGNPWELAWVHFNGAGAQAFYELFREKKNEPLFVPGEPGQVAAMVERIRKLLKENASELAAHAALTLLVADCIGQPAKRDIAAEIREFINKNYKEEQLSVLLTDTFGMTAEELSETFEKSCGIGIRDYILNRRFNAAKELLRFTIQPIGEIMEESGIRNEDLFYRLFQENEAMAPEEYRRRWAQWIKD